MRGEDELRAPEIVEIADDNHIWVTAMSLVRPSDDFLRDIGRAVVDKLRGSDVHIGGKDGPKYAKVTWIRINMS